MCVHIELREVHSLPTPKYTCMGMHTALFQHLEKFHFWTSHAGLEIVRPASMKQPCHFFWLGIPWGLLSSNVVSNCSMTQALNSPSALKNRVLGITGFTAGNFSSVAIVMFVYCLPGNALVWIIASCVAFHHFKQSHVSEFRNNAE